MPWKWTFLSLIDRKKGRYEVNTFQKNLAFLMGELNVSKAKLADRIGVSSKTLSRYLKGENTPKPDVLISIARAFECSVEDLWSYDFMDPDQNHPRKAARKPIASSREFAYFEGQTLFVYYLKEGTSSDFYVGKIELDDDYDKQRLYLHGHSSTGHEYDVKLVIEHHSGVFIYGISDEDERRFHIALHYPDFRDSIKYTAGVGILTRLDGQNVFVSQRVILTDTKIDTKNEKNRRCLLRILTHSDKSPRVWVNSRVNSEFRTGKWLDE